MATLCDIEPVATPHALRLALAAASIRAYPLPMLYTHCPCSICLAVPTASRCLAVPRLLESMAERLDSRFIHHSPFIFSSAPHEPPQKIVREIEKERENEGGRKGQVKVKEEEREREKEREREREVDLPRVVLGGRVRVEVVHGRRGVVRRQKRKVQADCCSRALYARVCMRLSISQMYACVYEAHCCCGALDR